MIEHIKKLFLAIILISCFTCFQRADYNLPLFTFSFFLWDYKQNNSQKTRLFYLYAFTWFIDFIWLIYWGVTWSSDEYKKAGSAGTSTFVLTLSIISFLIKLVVLVVAYVFDSEVKNAIRNFGTNVKSIFVYTPEKILD